MKKALITGVSGFAGSYLAEQLLTSGNYIVSGTYHSDHSLRNVSSKSKIKLHKVDLNDEKTIFDLIEKEKPEVVFHLAALASTADSFKDPKQTFMSNISMQINLLEAIKKIIPEAKILVVSSAQIYGIVAKENLPIDEETPFFPSNPYAVSKIAQDYLALQYFLSHKMKIVRVRPFNHVGPSQASHFVVADFAKRIVSIERGEEKIMKVGSLNTKRDFTDVRDMVRAYQLAVEKGKDGDVYNLGSGVSYEISKILDILISFSTKKIEVKQDDALIMPSDNPELRCDYSKFKSLTGWEPQIAIEKTLLDTLDYWRNVN